jgi:spore coat polysaccharide biosynthesis protein SpsF (cytidylyltransferase family)
MSSSPELVVVLEVPPEINADRIMKPVKGNLSILSLICDRMQNLVSPIDLIILTGRRSEDTPYGNFTALRGNHLHRSAAFGEGIRMSGVVEAAGGRRAKTVARVKAQYPFADPGLLARLIEFHNKQNAAYSCFDDSIPKWLVGDVFNTNFLIDAFIEARKAGMENQDASAFLLKEKQTYKNAVFRPGIKGRWTDAAHSLDNTRSETLVIDRILRYSDPKAVSYVDFLL